MKAAFSAVLSERDSRHDPLLLNAEIGKETLGDERFGCPLRNGRRMFRRKRRSSHWDSGGPESPSRSDARRPGSMQWRHVARVGVADDAPEHDDACRFRHVVGRSRKAVFERAHQDGVRPVRIPMKKKSECRSPDQHGSKTAPSRRKAPGPRRARQPQEDCSPPGERRAPWKRRGTCGAPGGLSILVRRIVAGGSFDGLRARADESLELPRL